MLWKYQQYNDLTKRIDRFFVRTAEADVLGDGIDPFSLSPQQMEKIQIV
jgi:hypothetical protein